MRTGLSSLPLDLSRARVGNRAIGDALPHNAGFASLNLGLS